MAKSHARFSPSKLESLEVCPCYQRIEDGDESAAQEGTLMHEAAETGDLAKLETEEQVNAVKEAVMFSDSVCAGAEEDRKEVRVEVDDLTFGTADRVARRGTALVVVDYKFGRLEVTPADKNLQGMCYASGAVLDCRARGFDITEVQVHLVCPRQQEVLSHTFEDVEALLGNTRARIANVLVEQDDPFKQPRDNAMLCGECRNAHRCPAKSKAVVMLAESATGLPMPSSFRPEAMVSVRDRAIGQVLSAFFEEWASQVKKQNAEFVFTTGQDIPGFARRERLSGVKLNDNSTLTVRRKLVELAGLTDNDIFQAAKLSFKSLVDVLAERTGRSADDARDFLKGILAEDLQAETMVRYLQKKPKTDFRALLGAAEKGGG